MRGALDLATKTAAWAAVFVFPDFRCEHEQLAMSHPSRYPIEAGTLASSSGLSFTAREFEQHVIEEQVPHSTALHARRAGRGTYLTGPLVRYSLNSRLLSPLARQVAAAAGLEATCGNPFRSYDPCISYATHFLDLCVDRS